LAERYARGEIDKAEFEERRQVIVGMREEFASGQGSRRAAAVDRDGPPTLFAHLTR
jgi:hypothetical protein